MDQVGPIVAGFPPGSSPEGPTEFLATDARLVELQQEQARLRRTESELGQRVLELEDASRSKDDFLAQLAHELRNPLGAISNAAQLMRLCTRQDTSPEEVRRITSHSLEIIERQVLNTTRMLDDLLDLTRIARGKVQLRLQPVELGGVLRNVLEAVQPLCAASGHELHVELPAEPFLVQGDPTRLEQVFTNLLNNAVKYTPPQGLLQVTVRRVEAEVSVRIADNGIGIAPSLLPCIFDLFVQGRQARSQAKGGIGLGLPLVRSLVELHGGTVQGYSPGLQQGSEFVVRLPLLQQAGRNPGGSRSTRPRSAVPGRRVLLVEDHRDAAEMLAQVLELSGHKVRVAPDGPRALQLVQDELPEVALLDIGLPGMDGLELGRRLRALEATQQQRILLIALSGYGQEEDRQRSREAGFDHHLLKPADLEELISLIGGRPRSTR